MPEIFKRFSSDGRTVSQDILAAYMDTVHFDRQLSSYESLIYGNFEDQDSLLQLPSQRYRYLQPHQRGSWKALLSGSEYILSILDMISVIEQMVEREHRRRFAWKWFRGKGRDSNANHYELALGKLRQSYYQLLQESAVLLTVLSERLHAWHQEDLPLQTVGPERFYHRGQEEESMFFKVIDSMVRLGAYQSSTVVSTTQGVQSSKSIEGSVAEFLASKQEQTQQFLNPLQLNRNKLLLLNKQHHSFWKSERYSARLTFMTLSYQRSRDLLQEADYASQSFLVQDTLARLHEARKKLNRVFHRRTCRLYRAFQRQLERRQAEVAVLGLYQYLKEDDCLAQDTLISRWVGCFSPRFKRAWALMIAGLQKQDHMNLDEWQLGFQQVCHALHLSEEAREALLKRLIKRYFVPVVESINDPAYPLIYRYLKVAAYDIVNPDLDDILAHLCNQEAWVNKSEATSHLLFLMGADQAQTARVSSQLNIVMQSLAFRGLFVDMIPAIVWQRLTSVWSAYGLSSVDRERLFDFQSLSPMGVEDSLFAPLILSEMSPESVISLSIEAWMQQLARWARLIDLILPAAQDTGHPYHLLSSTLFQKMLEQLGALSRHPDILKTDYFKQLLTYCCCHCPDENTQRTLAERLSRWQEPGTLSSGSVNKRPALSAVSQVFKRLSGGLDQTMEALDAISKSPNSQPLEKLLALSLTREDLQLLAREKEISGAEDRMTLKLLKTISETCFASTFCRLQAKYLFVLLSPESSEELKMTAVSQYLDVVSAYSSRLAGRYVDPKAANKGSVSPRFGARVSTSL